MTSYVLRTTKTFWLNCFMTNDLDWSLGRTKRLFHLGMLLCWSPSCFVSLVPVPKKREMVVYSQIQRSVRRTVGQSRHDPFSTQFRKALRGPLLDTGVTRLVNWNLPLTFIWGFSATWAVGSYTSGSPAAMTVGTKPTGGFNWSDGSPCRGDKTTRCCETDMLSAKKAPLSGSQMLFSWDRCKLSLK